MSQPRPDARLYTRRLCQATHNRVQNESRGDLAGSDADQPYVGRRRAWSRVVGGPFGARRVITCSILAFTGCLLALSGVTTSFGHFDVLYAMAGVLAVGATPVTYSRVLATRGCKLEIAIESRRCSRSIGAPITAWRRLVQADQLSGRRRARMAGWGCQQSRAHQSGWRVAWELFVGSPGVQSMLRRRSSTGWTRIALACWLSLESRAIYAFK